MSVKCLNCFRPMETCYCKDIVPIETGVKFVFLMHPKEAYKQRTGTGRLAHLSLPGSEILVGVDFTEHKRLNALLGDPHYLCCVLYPGADAWCVGDDGEKSFGKQRLAAALAGGAGCGSEGAVSAESGQSGAKRLLVVVVDATWPCARKILRQSPNVTALQKISFSAGYRSEFTFKREPKEDYVSTIESCYYLIRELQAAGLCPTVAPDGSPVDPEPLMRVFRKMVSFQLRSQEERIQAGIPDRYQAAGSIRAKKKAARALALERGAAPETPR